MYSRINSKPDMTILSIKFVIKIHPLQKHNDTSSFQVSLTLLEMDTFYLIQALLETRKRETH